MPTSPNGAQSSNILLRSLQWFQGLNFLTFKHLNGIPEIFPLVPEASFIFQRSKGNGHEVTFWGSGYTGVAMCPSSSNYT